MNKYIVAVSGGVDSVVLLDMLAKKSDLELIVAHFDHGIRKDSDKDAEFVRSLATKYNLPFELRREELGPKSSEETARIHRYKFLRDLAKKYDAKIVTAHHADDAIETVAINLLRGTGWRGLAAMDSDILRPLTDKTKVEIIDYAQKNNLQWRDDPTNSDNKYLRNQIRKNIQQFDEDTKRQLLALWSTQKSIKKMIESELKALVGEGPNYSRYFFTHISEKTAVECLRFITKARLTRPQILKVLHYIKTIQAGKSYSAAGVRINFTPRNFTVQLLK